MVFECTIILRQKDNDVFKLKKIKDFKISHSDFLKILVVQYATPWPLLYKNEKII